MLRRLVVLAACHFAGAFAQTSCPPINFLNAAPVDLRTSASSHIDILLQNDGSYTGFDVADSSPYRTISAIPHIEQRFANCLPVRPPSSRALPKPATNPPGQPSNEAVTMRTANGNYFVANIAGPVIRFRIFDSRHNFIAETTGPSESTAGGPGDPVEQFVGLSLADLNQDGKLDLIASTSVPFSGPSGIWVFPGNGDGTFQSGRKQVSVGPTGPFAVGDADGDGRNDIVFVSSRGALSAALGKGDFTFNAGIIEIAVPGLSPSSAMSVSMADLNGDGRQDLAVYTVGPPQTQSSYAIAVALSSGQGAFQPATFYPAVHTPSVGATVLAVGDLNEDGSPDIVSSSGTILFGDGKGGFPIGRDYVTPPGRAGSNGVIITDLDGDGRADIVIGDGSPVWIYGQSFAPTVVLFGSGGGAFQGAPVSVANPFGSNVQGAVPATADFNGDGKPDLVIAALSGASLQLKTYKGDGLGGFAAGTQQDFPVDSTGTLAAVVADFNKDGKPDLAVLLTVYPERSRIYVFINSGNGKFDTPLELKLPVYLSDLIAAQDLNGDRAADIVVAGSGGVLLIAGKGDGTFAQPSTAIEGNWPAFAVADFNNDGHQDIAAVNVASATVSVWAGRGDGTFFATAKTMLPVSLNDSDDRVPPNSRLSYGITAADFDVDGRMDLLISGLPPTYLGPNDVYYSTQAILVLSGGGDGSFTGLHWSVGPSPPRVVPADFNSDGIPDLVSNGVGVLAGTGDGTFGPQSAIFSFPGFAGSRSGSYTPGSTVYGVVVSDVNQDGLPDFVVVTSSGVLTALNISRPPAPLTVVSAASFAPDQLAPGSVAAAFGSKLASQTLGASLPTSPLSGLTVSVHDAAGKDWPAGLFFASGGQINFVVPPSVIPGPATVTVKGTPSGKDLTAQVSIAKVAPSLFAVNPYGLSPGAAAAYFVRVSPSGDQTIEPAFSFQNGYAMGNRIDLTQPGEVYLVLYGTGFDEADATSTAVTIQGLPVPVTYAGRQPTIPGLDQINIRLPQSLAGVANANISVSIGGKVSNSVFVALR